MDPSKGPALPVLLPSLLSACEAAYGSKAV